MARSVKGVIAGLIALSLITSCSSLIDLVGEENYRITNVRIYRNTPVWELARAVDSQNTQKIAIIAAENPELLDYQDPQFGTTLLFWAVGMEKYEAAEALLKAGANPNIISIYEGGTALYRMAGYSFIDNDAKKDPRFVELLLEYGADPNIGFIGNDRGSKREIGFTPLMRSIGCGIEKTRALVNGGANVNFRTESGDNAVSQALLQGIGGGTLALFAYVHYLVVEQQADITKPVTISPIHGDPFDAYDVTQLRFWTFPLNSEGHRLKMEVVEEFARQGVDYWATDIPVHTLDRIKKLYPDTWEEYINRY